MNENVKITSNVSAYFTDEFMESVRAMSNDEMISLMKDLEATRYWVALVKYSHERMRIAQQGLYTLDPFKDPVTMARNQGILTGLTDVQEAIISLKQQANKQEKETYEDQTKETPVEPMGY